MGDGRGINIAYAMGTTWGILKKTIDKEVEMGNGRLISDKEKGIYGIETLGCPIVFSKDACGKVREIEPECNLPIEVEQYRLNLKNKFRGLLN